VQPGEVIFPRIDMEKELKELEKTASPAESKKLPELLPQITIDDFAKLDLRVAKVLTCEKVEKSDKLLKLQLDIGLETRQVVSGIAQYYKPEEMVGKKVVLIANLKPAKLMGIESQGMILAASNKEEKRLAVVTIDADIPVGSRIS
jgi:methionyl-tRNA synthetase